MRTTDRLLVGTALVAGLLVAATVPALADTPATFGSHVSACAQNDGFSGSRNPGMHYGASGWGGAKCQ